MNRKILLIGTVFFAVFIWGLSAQDELLNPDLDLDNLFDTPMDDPQEPVNDGDDVQEGEGQIDAEGENGTALVDIVRGSNVTLGGNFDFIFGYAAGWNNVPWIPDSGGAGGSTPYSDGAVTDTKSSFNLNFRIAPVFRVYLTFKFSFPDFQSEIGEFFADYSIADAVFFRIGRQNHSWGISRYHPFTDLLNRLPDDWPGDVTDFDYINDADSYSFKMNIPVGVGGFEFIGLTRYGFMVDPKNPAVEEIGWGGNFNLAVPLFDATVGSFYHRDLPWRSYISGSTTLFQTVDVYSGFMVSYDFNFVPNDPSNPDLPSDIEPGDPGWNPPYYDESQPVDLDALDMAANIGFVVGLLNNRLNISGEYFYNGEERQLDVKGRDYPLIWGHNIAAGISWTSEDRKLRIAGQFNYNASENSGIVVPGITVDLLPFMSISAAVPIVFGDPDGTYKANNPADNQDRPASFVILAQLKGRF